MISVQRKMFMGIGKVMVPVPRLIASMGLKKGVSSAKNKAAQLTEEERKIHHFVVKALSSVKQPVTAEFVATELDMDRDLVEVAIARLESMKLFLYRSDGIIINWAYPVSVENTGHSMTDKTGERFFAA